MRAGQPFSLRYPLVEVEGSYGNLMESANWAAPRYTASRLSTICNNLFTDINKDTISDWRDNYDDTEKYPAVLPSKGFYNLVNGTSGIAVGLAASIPQFNITELNRALVTLLRNPDATFDEIYCAPDFATGGMIINENAVKESLKNGNGKACMIRAKIIYNEKENNLTVVEMPYGVYTNTVCKELEMIINSEENPGIDSINDLTGKEPKLKIYLEKGANASQIEQFLYKNTSLQSSYSVNMTMLDNGKYPKVFGWKEILQAHLAHEEEVYTRGYNYELNKIAHRLMIIDAIIKAIAKIEEVISTIKSSSSTSDANTKLQNLLNINEEQAKAILDIKLARLAKLEIDKFEKEKTDLLSEKERIENILSNRNLLIDEIANGLEAVAKKYGDARRTVMANIEIPKAEKEIAAVVPEDVVVIMTKNGNVKRIPAASFKVQNRNGKGIKTGDDSIISTISTNTIDHLMVFTDKGKMYRLVVDNVPIGTASTKGTYIGGLTKMAPDERPIAITSLKRNNDYNVKFIVFVTKNGIIKKSPVEEYIGGKRITASIQAIKLKENDTIASVTFLSSEDIVMVTSHGIALRVGTENINPQGRMTIGVKGIELAKDDCVIKALPINKETDFLAIFTKGGYAKKTTITEIPKYVRGAKGVMCCKFNNDSDTIVSAELVDDNDNIAISGRPNSICIAASQIPAQTRASIGVQVIKDSIILNTTKV